MDLVKSFLAFLWCLCSSTILVAQEFNGRVIIMSDQIAGVDPNIFRTMEQDATKFINTRKWTSDQFETKEKIDCIFTIILSKQIDGVEGGFAGRLSLQSSRPVYNTSYSSSLTNYTDRDFAFKYIQFQPFDFNDNRVNGNEALVSNLTAVLAYYCYIMLGLDYDSFSPKSGTEFFNKALNIVNNAPEDKNISGWKAMENQRNRFWLIDQMLNTRFAPMRDAFYQYHRQGLDLMESDPENARKNIYATFTTLQQVNTENPASIWMQFLFNAKSEEIRNIVSAASFADRQRLVPILSQLDVTNASKYAEFLKN